MEFPTEKSENTQPENLSTAPQDTPLFTNTFLFTKEMNREFIKKGYFEYYRFGIIMCYILTSMFLIFSLPSFYFIDWTAGVACILLSALYLLFASGYFVTKVGNRNYNTRLETLNGDMMISNLFYPDRIEMKTSTSSFTSHYEQIVDVIESKNLIALLIGKKKKNRSGIILLRSMFTPDELAQFYGFIIAKCPALQTKNI